MTYCKTNTLATIVVIAIFCLVVLLLAINIKINNDAYHLYESNNQKLTYKVQGSFTKDSQTCEVIEILPQHRCYNRTQIYHTTCK